MPPKRNESFDYAKMTVVQLRALLKEEGLPVSGKKAELVERLKDAMSKDAKVDKPKTKSKAKKKCKSKDDDCLCFRKKSEIVKIAVEKLGIEEKQANKFTVNKLCDILNKNIEEEFNNQYVLRKIEENKLNKNKKICDELKKIYFIEDDYLIKIYNKSISIHQSNIQGFGDFLENKIVVPELQKKNITYRQQVTIDNEGIIVGFNEKKRKCYHIIDFVIGNDIKIGEPIEKFKVISCKTTCRERWTQDDWSLNFAPEKYILLTLSNDYPSSNRFRESERRKIITCIPKVKDDRKYILGFEDLIEELI